MLSAQKPVELPLWPNGAPNNNELTNSGQNHNNEWMSDVTTPTLTVYPASHPNGMAIIMCPGGGYGGLAMKHEGHDIKYRSSGRNRPVHTLMVAAGTLGR